MKGSQAKTKKGVAAAVTPQPRQSGLLFIALPIIAAVVAAYLGGFLTATTGKRYVPPSHHRAAPQQQQQQQQQQPKPKSKPKASLAMVLDATSPWKEDVEFDAKSTSEVPECGFKELLANDLRPEMFQEGGELESTPLLIRGLTAKWPANENWERSKLIEKYGNKSVFAGSESSIVYGGGTATMPMKLTTFLASMRKPSDVMPDAFTFDVTVLDTIPELAKDYRVPLMFKSWDNAEQQQSKVTWHMLSLGSSRTGLPFHSHGKTWLALLHGSKRWLVYPPGFNAPAEAQARFNPLKPVHAWLEDVYPSLRDLPVAGSSSAAASRPIECIQRPGDIVYLPDGWAHMTVNVGEAIGVGGQTGLTIEERLRVGREAVSLSNDNFDGHKFAALALAHMGIEEEHRVKSQLTATQAGLVQLRADNFEEFVLRGEDTWLVQFFHEGSDSPPPEVSKTWNDVAARLKGIVSVGAMNVSQAFSPALYSELLASSSGSAVKVLLGNGARGSVEECLDQALAWQPSTAEESAEGEGAGKGEPGQNTLVEAFVDFAIDSTALQGGQRAGSVIAVTAKGKRLFAEAEVHQRKCLELQPLHPEGHGLLAELLGHAGMLQSMDDSLKAAAATYDELDASQYSPHSLASVYHKLATVYLGVSGLSLHSSPLSCVGWCLCPSHCSLLLPLYPPLHILRRRTVPRLFLFWKRRYASSPPICPPSSTRPSPSSTWASTRQSTRRSSRWTDSLLDMALPRRFARPWEEARLPREMPLVAL